MSTNDYLESFPKDTTEAWRTRVERDLKGKSYQDYLVWNSQEGFEIDAWQNTRPSSIPNLIASKSPWKIVEPIFSNDAQSANEIALRALNTGAEAIWFHKSFLGAAAQVASKGIDRSIAPVFIRGENTIDPYHSLLKNGTLPEEFGIAETIYFDGNRMRERGANTIDELALLLSQAIAYCEKTNYNKEPLFLTGVDNAFLTEIAKLRALRWLWKSVLVKAGKTPKNANILAQNLTVNYARNDEHTNILRATSSAMSAIIGGAQFVMIEPWNNRWKEANEFSARISRNIQNLLKEEARLNRNLNPADGSYFIENLTVKIAELAWEKVRMIEQSGGFVALAQSGKLKDMLSASAEKQLKDFQSNASILLGVNKFNPAERKAEAPNSGSHYELLPNVMNIPFTLQNQQS